MLITELKNEDGIYNGNHIEIKNQLSFVEKKLLCLDVLENCFITDENGIISCDYFTKYLLKDLKTVVHYTNIEFTDEFLSEYDFLVQNGIINYIREHIDEDELKFIDEMIECEVKQRIEIGNSLSNVVASKLQLLIDKLPTDKQLKSLSKSLVKDINKLNWDKMPMLKQMWETANGKSGGKDGE